MAENRDVPKIGGIYFLRQSVERAFEVNRASNNSHQSYSDSGSQSSSSTNNSRGGTQRPQKRPCLVWNRTSTECNVLLLTRLNGNHPGTIDNEGNSLFPNMKPEEVIKRLVPIHPTTPLIGQPLINFDRAPLDGERLTLSHNHYLLLIPRITPISIDWPPRSNAHARLRSYFSVSFTEGYDHFRILAKFVFKTSLPTIAVQFVINRSYTIQNAQLLSQ